ncbi:hypothetical protein [Cribrihabitans pelagius]|uniref:hypothetical protein n=1 Tax=Cribrihabitans pelagius TaxID=1765746 RepID=UPI003B5915B2
MSRSGIIGHCADVLGTLAVPLSCWPATTGPCPRASKAAFDGSIRGLWCHEASQASSGELLSPLAEAFPRGRTATPNFAFCTAAAAKLQPDEGRRLALDWRNGNRVLHANSVLSVLLVALPHRTGPVDIFRAPLEAHCFNMRQVFNLLETGRFRPTAPS